MNQQQEPILKVKNLKQYFKSGFGKNKLIVKAVDDVSFKIYKGEVFGLVGESGCGKTTTGRTIIKLYEPTDGEIEFMGETISAGVQSLKDEVKQKRKDFREEVSQLKSDIEDSDDSDEDKKRRFKEEVEKLKKEKNSDIKKLKDEIKRRKELTNNASMDTMKRMQMIFQDPVASLNPRMTVREIIAEGLRIAGENDLKTITKKVNDVLETVGLLPEHSSRYPHEFSGGQRQRIGLGRALVVAPEFIIADEPISALDVSIQAQVINLLNDLRHELGLTIMFIAHDLSVINYFSDRIAVMYFGKMVEMTTKDELFKNPLHPYTRSLLSAVPLPDPNYEKTRERMSYDPSIHDYSKESPELHEIKEGHFIYANTAELEEYKKMMK